MDLKPYLSDYKTFICIIKNISTKIMIGLIVQARRVGGQFTLLLNRGLRVRR